MVISIAGILSFIFLCMMMIFLIAIGQRVGKNKKRKPALDITEAAIFTLMALLVTFTFSSAGSRFDQRRMIIVDEVNAISTAYLRLDILQESDRQIIKKEFLSYVSSRLAIYQALPDFDRVNREMHNSRLIQDKLWRDVILACQHSKVFGSQMLLLPAINSMFDIASKRVAYSMMHPHIFIFILLITVVLLSSFLIGYGIYDRGAWGSLHILAFAFITAFTIYVIIDLEYPRFGFIQETQFDLLLSNLIENFHTAEKTMTPFQ